MHQIFDSKMKSYFLKGYFFLKIMNMNSGSTDLQISFANDTDHIIWDYEYDNKKRRKKK